MKISKNLGVSKAQEERLVLKLTKCFFYTEESSTWDTQLLIMASREAMKSRTGWPLTKDKKDVKSFLGFCTQFRRFIQGFAKISKPSLTLPRTKPLPGTISNKQLLNIEEQITRICSHGFHRQQETLFLLHVDASQFAIGAFLGQIDDITKKGQPIAFFQSNSKQSAAMMALNTTRNVFVI